jgi:hypothetical protein
MLMHSSAKGSVEVKKECEQKEKNSEAARLVRDRDRKTQEEDGFPLVRL